MARAPRGTECWPTWVLGYSTDDRLATRNVGLGNLVSLCWCRDCYIVVPDRMVLDGETRSCGRSTCNPPDISLLGIA